MMHRCRLMLVVGLPLVMLIATGCGTQPSEALRGTPGGVDTDGTAVYVVSETDREESEVVSFNADGDVRWRTTVETGRSSIQAIEDVDDAVWVVGDLEVPILRRPRRPVRVVKLDSSTGEILGTLDLEAGPRQMVEVDGNLWALQSDQGTATVIDPATVTPIETVNIRAGGQDFPLLGGEDGGPILLRPFVMDGLLYYTLTPDMGDDLWVVKYSLEDRRVVAERSLGIEAQSSVFENGELWILDSTIQPLGRMGYLAYNVDLETLTAGPGTPRLDTPYDNLITEDAIFDLIEDGDTLVQLDPDTGEVVRRFEDRLEQGGGRALFVIDDHVWLSNLERHKID